MKTNKTILILYLFIVISLLISSCMQNDSLPLPVVSDYDISDDTANTRTHLKVGVVSGPYGDMFLDAIYPSLQEMGYTAELVHYDDYSQPNYFLAIGEIDLNMFQHYLYMINSKFDNDMCLSAIAEIPTASMGVYSTKHKSIYNIPTGSTFSMPNDGTNLARSLTILENADIIKLNPYIDKTKARIEDVISNPRNIRWVPLEANVLVRTLSSYDFSVINGNYALSGGLDLSKALYTERLGAYYYNIIAVRTEDLGEQFVSDIIKVLRSDDFKAVIEDKNNVYSAFQRPLNFYEK